MREALVFEHLAVRVVQLQVGRRHLAGERVFGFNLARDSIKTGQLLLALGLNGILLAVFAALLVREGLHVRTD